MSIRSGKKQKSTRESGNFGEEMATKFLQSKGMKLLEKNFYCKTGEIDLIFRDKNVLVFVEVKLRHNPYFGLAAYAVTDKKKKKIINTARYYIQSHKLYSCMTRFDVIGIDFEEGEWKCNYYRNAFLAA